MCLRLLFVYVFLWDLHVKFVFFSHFTHVRKPTISFFFPRISYTFMLLGLCLFFYVFGWGLHLKLVFFPILHMCVDLISFFFTDFVVFML